MLSPRAAGLQVPPQMDVLIINYRPDVPAKLGIDYETLAPMNPRLIYCQNTAFGLEGPHGHRPGSDIVTQSMTGLMTRASTKSYGKSTVFPNTNRFS